MIITKKKDFYEILKHLKDGEKIFVFGCGECATTCKTGGEPEILEIKQKLEQQGKIITGWVIPEAPCVTSQIKMAVAKNIKAIKEADSLLILACQFLPRILSSAQSWDSAFWLPGLATSTGVSSAR